MKIDMDINSAKEKMMMNTFMFGFEFENKVDSEKYRFYVTLVSYVRQMLDECMINTGCKGYLYIQDCIVTIFDQHTMNIRFNKDVYPYVAFKYGIKDPSNIEHSIRNALVAAYRLNEAEGCRRSEIMSSFGRRPTNKEFLLYLTLEIYTKLWNESVEFA